MCRRNHLRGCLCLGIGIGLIAGYALESWTVCTLGGMGLLLLGLIMLKQK